MDTLKKYKRNSLKLALLSLLPLTFILAGGTLVSVYLYLGDGRLILGILNGWYVIIYNFIFGFNISILVVSKLLFLLFVLSAVYYQLRIKGLISAKALFIILIIISAPFIILNFSGFDYSQLQNISLKNSLSFYHSK